MDSMMGIVTQFKLVCHCFHLCASVDKYGVDSICQIYVAIQILVYKNTVKDPDCWADFWLWEIFGLW